MQRMVVIADNLFETPARVQSELRSFIELDTLRSECEGISSFVDPELRHQRFSRNMLRQSALGIEQCDVLEDLAIQVYEEIKINQVTSIRERLDELYRLWIHVA